MTQDLLAGTVAILSNNGAKNGTGFVVHKDGLIVTCSHVVQSESDQKSNKPRSENVRIVFRHCGEERLAKVETQWWRPYDAEDVAILRIEGGLPTTASELPLGSSINIAGHEFDSFGYPRNYPAGLWGHGRLGNPIQDQTGLVLVQLRDAKEIVLGFSGAPVWDKSKNCVVGMIASFAKSEQGRLEETAFVIPNETLLAVCPRLEILHGLDIFYKSTQESLSAVPDKIGRNISIPRDQEISKLAEVARTHSLTFVAGPPGCGKTVLVKMWVQKKAPRNTVIWWNASLLGSDDFATFESTLRLPDALLSALLNKSSDSAYLVVDGLDRQYKPEAFKNLSVVLRALNLGKDGPWRVVITSQDEDVERLRSELSGCGVEIPDMGSVPIQEPLLRDLTAIWEAFPDLGRLVLQEHLHRLLLKPKVLDLFARRLAAGGSVDTSKWTGESDLIVWFWSGEVQSGNAGPERDRFLKLMAEKQADELVSEIPADEFSVADLGPVAPLINDGILKRTEGGYAFQHDLFGDWSRQRILLGRRKQLEVFLEDKLGSPLWHRAVRLLGLHLLEQESLSAWEKAFEDLGTLGDGALLVQDLMLESVVFAAGRITLLEEMRGRLVANEGWLLRRLLYRFLHVATYPNSVVKEIERVLGLESQVQSDTVERIPYRIYWPPVIQFLHNHKEQTLRLAPKLVAEICEKWLRYASSTDAAMGEAANMALDLAEDKIALRMVYWRGHRDEFDRLVFKAALAACRADLERSIDLARTACGRKEPSTRILEKMERYEALAQSTGKVEHLRSQLSHDRMEPVHSETEGEPNHEALRPWPDGPRRHVVNAFADACFRSDALHPLILIEPASAKEIILASLMEPPAERAYHGSRRDGFSKLGLTMEDQSFYPPLYLQGPFNFFLQNRFDEGLDLIVRLVDFVTARWEESHDESLEITIDFATGPKSFVGDQRVFHWYRAIGSAPHAVASALMALENWFYNQLEESNTTTRAINTILENSNSLALLGLLCGVGKREPVLFIQDLQPLLSVPEFHFWDWAHLIQGEQLQMFAWTGLGNPDWMRKLAHGWHSLEHRQIPLLRIAIQLLVESEEMRQFFDGVVPKWQARIDSGREGDRGTRFLRQLVRWFDRTNLRQWKDQDGNVFIFSQPPSEPNGNQVETDRLLQQRMRLIALPDRLWRYLVGEDLLLEEDIESLWEQVQDIASLRQVPGHDFETFGPEHCLTGLAAVLIKHHRDWLRRYPDRKRWCVQVIVDAVLNPPQSPPFDSEVIHTKARWQGFCASAIPILWTENPSSQEIRRCVALLATDFHYDTIRILFESATRCRNPFRKDLSRLRHVAMRWAAARWATMIIERVDQSVSPLPEWREKETLQFSRALVPAVVPPWADIRLAVKKELPEEQLKESRHERKTGETAYLDLHVVVATHSWLPALNEALDEAERTEWLVLWTEALNYSLNLIQECLNQGSEFDSTNDEWYRWLFDRLALVVRSMMVNEEPQGLWRPILELGKDGHYWIEAFLSSWFMVNLQIQTFPETFIAQWRKMIEFVSDSPDWSVPAEHRTYDLDTMWCNLMGFGGYWVKIWDESHRDKVQEMEVIYESWAREYLVRRRCAMLFAIFLKQPAAVGLLFKGLTWLETATKEAGKYYLEDKETVDQISSLLGHCWNTQRSELLKDTDAVNSFRYLLTRLAEQHDPVANEILRQIVVQAGG